MTGAHHTEEIPQRVYLERSRALRGAERALLTRLVDQTARAELMEQINNVRVNAVCSCGCPSIMLETDGPAVPAAVTRRYEPESRDDYLAVSAHGRDSQGRPVDVTLHVLNGCVEELEIWAGSEGGDPHTDVPSFETLDFK